MTVIAGGWVAGGSSFSEEKEAKRLCLSGALHRIVKHSAH
jgi:hypothetical protein